VLDIGAIGAGQARVRAPGDLSAALGGPQAAGKLVADAQHAAVAIEHGCTLVSTDSDFDRVPELRWQHPLRAER
jgi:predicted nucleic acid-binding protein